MCGEVMKMVKVRVWLPFETKIPYIVEVKNIDIDSIKEAMYKLDPSEWEYEPQFYEEFGCHYFDVVEKLTEEDIEIIME